MDEFGRKDGTRLILNYIRRRSEAWKKYDIDREILTYVDSKNQRTAWSKNLDREWMSARRDVEQRRRGLSFPRTMVVCWREFWRANWLKDAMKKWIEADSESSHDPLITDMDRIKLVLVKELRRLDDEYINLLEQKAIENETQRLLEEKQVIAMSELEKSLAWLRTYRDEVTDSKYKA
ncbi:hypothetical protein E4U55_005396 [Claviceps digitariae]|nr:hypothetical protein E4U55_005396 [Claviceps digitariae]